MSAWLVCLSVLLGALAGAAPASAFELLRFNNDPCARQDRALSWAAGGVPVDLTALPDSRRDLADLARERWNLSLSRFRFGVGSGGACVRDGVVALVVADTPCGLAQFGDALAITRSIWNGAGELVDADVTFNANRFIIDNDAAFLEVAMHELGHVLGLDHSDACGASGAGTIMESRLTPPRLEAPQADDVAGAETLYPTSGGGGGTVPDGANACAVTAPDAGGAAAWPLLGAMALLAWRWRRLD